MLDKEERVEERRLGTLGPFVAAAVGVVADTAGQWAAELAGVHVERTFPGTMVQVHQWVEVVFAEAPEMAADR